MESEAVFGNMRNRRKEVALATFQTAAAGRPVARAPMRDVLVEVVLVLVLVITSGAAIG